MDHKKRITAEDSLNHPYFIPVPHGMQKLAGTNDLVSDPLFKNQAGNNSMKHAASPRNSGFGPDQLFSSPRGIDSPKSVKNSAQKDRFAEKDSLYLDMGKTEFNGKTDTINTTASNGNSLLMNRRDSNVSIGSNSDSVSAFANKAPIEKRSRSFRVHNNAAGSNKSVRMAALLRNMQKNNGEPGQGEESKDDMSPSTPVKEKPRRFSERLVIKNGGFSERSSSNGPDNDSEDEQSPGFSPKLKLGMESTTPDNSSKGRLLATPKRRFQPFAQKSEAK